MNGTHFLNPCLSPNSEVAQGSQRPGPAAGFMVLVIKGDSGPEHASDGFSTCHVWPEGGLSVGGGGYFLSWPCDGLSRVLGPARKVPPLGLGQDERQAGGDSG